MLSDEIETILNDEARAPIFLPDLKAALRLLAKAVDEMNAAKAPVAKGK